MQDIQAARQPGRETKFGSILTILSGMDLSYFAKAAMKIIQFIYVKEDVEETGKTLQQRFQEFILDGENFAEELPEGLFRGVTFKRITIANWHVASIHPSALLSSQDQLETLWIWFTPMKEFPWDTLPLFTQLTSFVLVGNELAAVRSLRSLSLQEFDVSANHIATLESGWSAPSLTTLLMSMNPISAMPLDFFVGLRNLREFHCFGCHLGPTLFNGSLRFHSEMLTSLELGYNGISNIEEGAIGGITSDTMVGLEGNNIVELKEATFRPMLEVLARGIGFLNVMDNPISCGCSMAWIVLNPDFLVRVSGYCQDGSSFRGLDPNLFEEFCIEMNPPMAGNFSTWIAENVLQ
ncbi:unnamed protein product [Darwinula stevensoni]|uniref:Uncharacterized protein n=1 Tax=Darwinula stevensoni TaxID=69355 RepID=A0A7R8X9L8_9CRUS|nr:unnamed protein product [Darwinula stevensoni]CAG0889268.1 unnamed protein product [Darwinula stevensoni]